MLGVQKCIELSSPSQKKAATDKSFVIEVSFPPQRSVSDYEHCTLVCYNMVISLINCRNLRKTVSRVMSSNLSRTVRNAMVPSVNVSVRAALDNVSCVAFSNPVLMFL